MNCQELHALLDAHPEKELDSVQRLDVERHVGACQACREVWAIHGELVGEVIPETPRDLRRRVATAIDSQTSDDVRRVRRSILLGGVVIAGVAVAKTLSLGLEQREQMCA